MSIPSDTYLTGQNIDFIETQYQRWLEDPASVDASWAELFGAEKPRGKPLVIDGLKLGNGHNGHAKQVSASVSRASALQSKVDQAVFSFRLRGHLLAQLDPLGQPRPVPDHVADIAMVSKAHFSDDELGQLVDPQTAFDEPMVPLSKLLERMRKTYCGTIGVEMAHLADSERRRWLQRKIEFTDNRTDFNVKEQERILLKLTQAEAFEACIHTKFQAQKRFSIEGGESLIPMLDACLELGGSLGVREVVLGMAHRGRLNALANILGKPEEEIFSEIAGPANPQDYLGRGDVKYHLGYSCDWQTEAGQKIHVSLAFNPSHLQVVHPVVEGRVRAKQDRFGEGGEHAVLPLVIHGDAAFAGQGLVAEVLNFSSIAGYQTGGTLHVVVNNQVGYTTDPDQGRSSIYCTGVAQMLDIPIFHVNADDVEACVHVMQIATEYRQRFQTDVVIDLVCYRKYGHNEGDEPAFTQPKMYELIRSHPTARTLYAKKLDEQKRVSLEQSGAMLERVTKEFNEAHARASAQPQVKEVSAMAGLWKEYKGGNDADVPEVVTGVSEETLRPMLERLAQIPEGFVLHPNIVKSLINKRRAMLENKEHLDWSAGEMLAYATLVSEGYSLRLTGQDTERGTFAHRHAVLHDQQTGRTAFPLGTLAKNGTRVCVLNSPLSEMGCMGFEFGYSLDAPDALVAWEAQFGDFANNGQVMVDQFIAAAEDKWNRLSGLVLLLPHGYEGQGPEHSSARLERYLQLAAEDNLQVCYPTNSAQMFHLLRRQLLRKIRKPLVVMTPKGLLRLPEAGSPWSDFTQGTFKKVIAEQPADPAKVKRLLLCSGRVFYDLFAAREAAKNDWVAIARVEQLYPFPAKELKATLSAFPKLEEVCWVQEEPRNMGSWRTMNEWLNGISSQLPPRYIGRPESASPATGFLKTHQYEQKLLVAEALARKA